MISIPWSARRLSEVELADALYETDLRKTDLSGIDLSGRDLYGSILESVDLSKANLTEANLNRTKLRWADLTSTTLKDACVTDADLSNTKLIDADLTGADLSRTVLDFADLTGANLSQTKLAHVIGLAYYSTKLTGVSFEGADFTDTNLSGVNLMGTNLKGAIGLGTKQDEIEFCQQVLQMMRAEKIFTSFGQSPKCLLDVAPSNTKDYFSRKSEVSRRYPTVARYLTSGISFAYAEEDSFALWQIINQIASGELSVFPD